MINVVDKIKQANLVGRGGASYPVAAKWECVKAERAAKKFVVANGSEGEPGIRKDRHILLNHPERVVDGVRIAMRYLDFGDRGRESETRGYIYLNQEYYREFSDKLQRIIHDDAIVVFEKPHEAGYIGGEESAVLNVIEGERAEPRLKPPYPTQSGLWGYPTLVNNIETFYDVSLAAAGLCRGNRFFTVGGDCLRPGVFEFPAEATIAQVLKDSKNYPDYEFFVQVGGDAAGDVLNATQLDRPVTGGGSITVYSRAKYQPNELIKRWMDFYALESCGQCTPCREGTYRLQELLKAGEVDWGKFRQILDAMRETSFCGLGASVPWAVESYLENIVKS